ncbi:MAG: hypothetical protein GX817_04755, partial [Elusimicrobia bacterium]|nr:hypothetical protein [Elusimicrobiota bacterium]
GGGSDVSQRYGARGIPTFVIMDAEGKILISRSGFAPPLYEDWTSILESQLK